MRLAPSSTATPLGLVPTGIKTRARSTAPSIMVTTAKLGNDATPFTAAPLTGLCSLAAGFGVGTSASVTTSCAGTTRLLYWSWIATCTAGAMVSPARPRVGCVMNARRAGGPATLVAVKVTAGKVPAVVETVFVPTRDPSVQLPALTSPAGSLVL